jgi:IS5 family transposase
LLVVHNLDRSLFETLTLQLKSKVVVVKTGTLIDATIIASASEEDDDAHWVKHKGKPAVPGFKAYVGADADTALVEEVSITPANINDGRAGPERYPTTLERFLLTAPIAAITNDAVRAKGGMPRIVATGMWGQRTTTIRAQVS